MIIGKLLDKSGPAIAEPVPMALLYVRATSNWLTHCQANCS